MGIFSKLFKKSSEPAATPQPPEATRIEPVNQTPVQGQGPASSTDGQPPVSPSTTPTESTVPEDNTTQPPAATPPQPPTAV